MMKREEMYAMWSYLCPYVAERTVQLRRAADTAARPGRAVRARGRQPSQRRREVRFRSVGSGYVTSARHAVGMCVLCVSYLL